MFFDGEKLLLTARATSLHEFEADRHDPALIWSDYNSFDLAFRDRFKGND
jgi:hypothetical protein